MTKETLLYNANLAFSAGEGHDAILFQMEKLSRLEAIFAHLAKRTRHEQIDLQAKPSCPASPTFTSICNISLTA